MNRNPSAPCAPSEQLGVINIAWTELQRAANEASAASALLVVDDELVRPVVGYRSGTSRKRSPWLKSSTRSRS